MMDKSITLGRRIREKRLEKKISQRDLAERVAKRLKEDDRRGFDFTYLSKIENDRLEHPPSAAAIQAIATELDDNSDELLALAGKAPPDVGEMLKQSQGARMFFRSAISENLTEDQWQKLIQEMKRKKKT